MTKLRSELRYYEIILGMDLKNMDAVLEHLKSKCDSKLEILFALCLLVKSRIDESAPSIEGEFIAIEEPWNTSPSGIGCSRAFLKCQVVSGVDLWDFGIWKACNNGSTPKNSELNLLIDIDGFGPHSHRRHADRSKIDRSIKRCMKLPEEAFKSVFDMADIALHSSIWSCCCGMDDSMNGGFELCDIHERLGLKSVNNFKRGYSGHDY